MELFGFILSVLAALALVVLLKRLLENSKLSLRFLILLRTFRREKPAPPPTTRMLVAIRRRRTGRTNLPALEAEGHQAFLHQIREQLHQLCAHWATLAMFEWGFHGSDYGLPSPSDDCWLLFASYVVADYAAFRACMATLDSDQLLLLRDHCEIRLLFGEKMTDPSAHLKELF